jgi:hypothetical protein
MGTQQLQEMNLLFVIVINTINSVGKKHWNNEKQQQQFDYSGESKKKEKKRTEYSILKITEYVSGIYYTRR